MDYFIRETPPKRDMGNKGAWISTMARDTYHFLIKMEAGWLELWLVGSPFVADPEVPRIANTAICDQNNSKILEEKAEEHRKKRKDMFKNKQNIYYTNRFLRLIISVKV